MTDERKSKITDATPEKVTPPRAFWRWPWHDWSVWEKSWMGARLAVRSLLAVAGLITAATLLVQFAPSAWERIVWRPAEYSMLSQLHAGYSIDYIKAKLGEPALVDSSPRIPDYRALTFVRRDYFVQAIVSGSGRVEALTTVSCSPDFMPTFKAPSQKQIVLQAAPLAQAEQVDQDTSQSTANNPNDRRNLYYFPGKTATSLDAYLEGGDLNGSGSQGLKSFYVGISSLCIEPSNYPDIFSAPSPPEPFIGSADNVPSDFAKIRQQVAPNLYCEIAAPSSLFLANDGQLALNSANQDTLEEFGDFSVGPFHLDIPRDLQRTTGTRVFGSA